MKKLTLILTIILSLCFSLLTACSLAEENNILELLLTTDKAEYTGGETIVATLTVTNNYAVDIALIQMENFVPENCELAVASKATATVENLESGETAELVTRFVTPSAVVLPQTGDTAHPMMWFALAAVALAGMTWLFVCRRKAFFCLLAVLMVSALLTSGGVVLARADVQSNVTTVSTAVMVDGMPLVLHAEVIEGAGKNLYKEPADEHIQPSADEFGYYVNNQLLLVAHEDVTLEEIEQLVSSHNATVVGYLYLTDDYQIEFPAAYTEAELEAIGEEWMDSGLLLRTDINSAWDCENASESDSASFPNDPSNTGWALRAINAHGAWQYRDQFTYPKIGIYDNYFYDGHVEFNNLDLRIHNLPATPPKDDPDHGTHVMGIIAAEPNNNEGITGLALHPQVEAYAKQKNVAGLKLAFTELITSGCKVINISQRQANVYNEEKLYELKNEDNYAAALARSKERGELLDDFIQKLIEDDNNPNKDFLIVQAAGNDSINALLSGFFAYCEDNKDRIIVVGNVAYSSDSTLCLYETSNYGSRVDIVAPGYLIDSTVNPVEGYSNSSGSSMSAPFVSATAALCYAINPNATCTEIKQAIVDAAEILVVDKNKTSNDIFCDRYDGTANESKGPERVYKLLNSQKAIELIGGITPNENMVVSSIDFLSADTEISIPKLNGMLKYTDSPVKFSHSSANPVGLTDAQIIHGNDTHVYYVQKNGDWAEFNPNGNKYSDTHIKIKLTKFDSQKPYVTSTKQKNVDGTTTFYVEVVNAGSLKTNECAIELYDKNDQIIFDTSDAVSSENVTFTNTSISATVDATNVHRMTCYFSTDSAESFFREFFDDIGWGEVRYNLGESYDTGELWFQITNPIDENYSTSVTPTPTVTSTVTPTVSPSPTPTAMPSTVETDINVRFIDPDTNEPVPELNGMLEIFYKDTNVGEHYFYFSNPSNPPPLEECSFDGWPGQATMTYVQKNGDWASINFEAVHNGITDLGDVVLTKFDPAKPYVRSRKIFNGDGTITFKVETVNLSTAAYQFELHNEAYDYLFWYDADRNESGGDLTPVEFDVKDNYIAVTFDRDAADWDNLNCCIRSTGNEELPSSLGYLTVFDEIFSLTGWGEVRYTLDTVFASPPSGFGSTIENPIDTDFN